MNIFQFFIICKRTKNANNATHYMKLGKKRRESSKRNSPRVTIKAIIIIICIHIYICLFINMYICVCVCIYIHIHIYVCIHTHMIKTSRYLKFAFNKYVNTCWAHISCPFTPVCVSSCRTRPTWRSDVSIKSCWCSPGASPKPSRAVLKTKCRLSERRKMQRRCGPVNNGGPKQGAQLPNRVTSGLAATGRKPEHTETRRCKCTGRRKRQADTGARRSGEVGRRRRWLFYFKIEIQDRQNDSTLFDLDFVIREVPDRRGV